MLEDRAYKGIIPYLTLPNPHHLPPLLRQEFGDQPVALLIAGAFGIPVGSVLGGFGIAAVVAVPEAAIGKDSDALFGEDEIRLAGERIIAPPAFDSVRLEEFDQFQLRGAIAPGFHLAHDLAALFGSEGI